MKIKPLTQLRELIAAALKSQTNLSKTFHAFFIETMELILTHTERLNFTQMARCGRTCESRFRQNVKKPFDWLSFNKTFLESTKGHRIAIAIDPCYTSKSGKIDLKNLDMSVFKEDNTVQCFTHIRQPRQGLCPTARDESLSRFYQNPTAQRCNGGSIYCNVRKITEHAIK